MDQIRRADCPHGVEYGRGGFAKIVQATGHPFAWNGGVSRCDCCVSSFGYLGSPPTLCTDCGGSLNNSTHVWSATSSSEGTRNE